MTRICFIHILTLLLASLLLTVNGNCSERLYSLQEKQTLYFTIDEITLGSANNTFLMDTSPPSGETPRESQEATFVSLPLAAYFEFTNLTITVHHTNITSTNYPLHIEVGWLDPTNESHTSHEDYKILEIGTTVASFSFATECCGINVFEQNRLWTHIRAEGEGLHIIWGGIEHDSRVSFDGTAHFVPEFPSIIILPIFMTLTLLTALILRKRKRK